MGTAFSNPAVSLPSDLVKTVFATPAAAMGGPVIAENLPTSSLANLSLMVFLD